MVCQLVSGRQYHRPPYHAPRLLIATLGEAPSQYVGQSLVLPGKAAVVDNEIDPGDDSLSVPVDDRRVLGIAVLSITQFYLDPWPRNDRPVHVRG